MSGERTSGRAAVGGGWAKRRVKSRELRVLLRWPPIAVCGLRSTVGQVTCESMVSSFMVDSLSKQNNCSH